MSRNNSQYYITTKELINPWKDKRCKYNIGKFDKFEAGMKVVKYTYSYETSDKEWHEYYIMGTCDSIPQSIYDKKGDRLEGFDIETALGLVPYQLSEWEQFEKDCSSSTGVHSDILQLLLKQGKVSLQDITEAYSKIED
jgi:hypothetical protein